MVGSVFPIERAGGGLLFRTVDHVQDLLVTAFEHQPEGHVFGFQIGDVGIEMLAAAAAAFGASYAEYFLKPLLGGLQL